MKECKFFKEFGVSLTDADWLCLGMGAWVETVEPLTSLCIEGMAADNVYFNLRGRVIVTKTKKRKVEHISDIRNIIAVLPEGSGIGEQAVVYNIAR